MQSCWPESTPLADLVTHLLSSPVSTSCIPWCWPQHIHTVTTPCHPGVLLHHDCGHFTAFSKQRLILSSRSLPTELTLTETSINLWHGQGMRPAPLIKWMWAPATQWVRDGSGWRLMGKGQQKDEESYKCAKLDAEGGGHRSSTHTLLPVTVITTQVTAALPVIWLNRVRVFGCTGLQGRILPRGSERSSIGLTLLWTPALCLNIKTSQFKY